MGNKFYIRGTLYPYKGYSDYSYGTENIFKFLFMLIKVYRKYEIVDVAIRQHKRMKLREEE